MTTPTETGAWQFRGLAIARGEYVTNDHQFPDWTPCTVSDHHDGFHGALPSGRNSILHVPVRDMRGKWRRSEDAVAECVVYAVVVNGVVQVFYPRRIQAECYATGFSGKHECQIIPGTFVPSGPPVPMSPTS